MCLLYVGDGQYYDPSTGRFLTRGSNPSSPNPYLPFDPTGAMLGPLGVLALVLGSKKKKSKVDVLLFVLAFAAVTGMALSACVPGNGGNSNNNGNTEWSSIPPTSTQSSGGAGNDSGGSVANPGSGTQTLTITCTLTPTSTSTPTPTPTGTPTQTPNLSDAQWLLQMFGIELLNGSESPEGIWDTRLAGNARRAVEDIARKFSKITGDDTYTAFRKNFDTYGKKLVMKKVSSFTTHDGTVVYGGGYTNGPHLIHYAKINCQSSPYNAPENSSNIAPGKFSNSAPFCEWGRMN